MSRNAGLLLCLAYILGVAVAPIDGAKYYIIAVGAIAAFVVPRYWRGGPKAGVYALAAVIAAIAGWYFHWRLPQPPPVNWSLWTGETATVQGVVLTEPRVTRSQQLQFTLQAIDIATPTLGQHPLTAKLYTTIPLLQGTGLHTGHSIDVTGRIYEPRPAAISGGFDFRTYLARKGIFAGLVGKTVKFERQEVSWGWWQVRKRIVRSLVRGLDVPEGLVVASIVMGRRAVDLPFSIRDEFIQVGLAHVLAASGFHISLVLGLILALTERFSQATQLKWGIVGLVLYSSLTGFQPSILRAVFMGLAALIGKVLDRRVNVLRSLFLTATILLLFNPLWIQDLGFQLSFLSTLGLVVTVPVLMRQWDALPPAIASAFAVPASALIWTLPLQLYSFGLVSPYSIFVNIIAIPFILLATIGGLFSSILGLVWSSGGSWLATLLYYPTQGLIAIVHWFSQLPGNSVALGKISLLQLLLLYGLILGFWLMESGEKPGMENARSPWILLTGVGMAFAIVIVPGWHVENQQSQITVLPTRSPVAIVQSFGTTIAIGTPDLKTAEYTLIPFLQSEGINRLDASFSLDRKSQTTQGWLKVLDAVTVTKFYDAIGNNSNDSHQSPIQESLTTGRGNYQSLTLDDEIAFGAVRIRALSVQPQILELKLGKQRWSIVAENEKSDDLCEVPTLCQEDTMETVLVWTGTGLSEQDIAQIQPEVAIVLSADLDPDLKLQLESNNTQVFVTGIDGTIQWNSRKGFPARIDSW
ncbi:ComEC/Rec2 family competence protein [Roseofilum casamattae]|uniref:ComEC/Rec2 family competence protein n=1 Tax=Roseofilum casamattae BLCC-M143 TaxID=3022442 RepID=A0ABT7C2R1_9CYAN|nr:ComEC/Rec2 family competence protein [Roseofilum casamattae]MDJ1185724.1 ComEC/Rec2 family competence protein [Roseofilum casamattae BLCC-M143]